MNFKSYKWKCKCYYVFRVNIISKAFDKKNRSGAGFFPKYVVLIVV